jgi:Predicted integral membrane protein
LSQVYLKDEQLARKTALLYILSPASIFFSAFYTETFFCLFTLLGYYLLYKGDSLSYKNIILSSLAFAISGFIRSNGFFYLAIVGYQLLHKWLKLLNDDSQSFKTKLFKTNLIFAVGGFIVIIMVLPYFLVMKKPYETYCIFLKENELISKPSFCQNKLPNPYSYIQDKFWDVGFLTSWVPRKAFFVIWGLPMLILMLIILVKYLSKNFKNTVLLGIPRVLGYGSSEIEKDAFYMSKNIPTIIFTGVMFIVNAFFAHVNVSSRINSANPIIYWYAAYAMSRVRDDSKQSEENNFSWKNHWILYYFIFYVVVGCTVFTNFYLFV